MKVLIDHQIFSVQEYGGISRSYAELYKELNKLGVECEISAKVSNNYYLPDIGQKSFFKNISFFGKLTLMEQYNRLFTVNKLSKGNYDVFQPTYFDPYFLDYLGKKPFVLGVYDLIHEKILKDLPSSNKILKWKKMLVEKATKIIAISEATKNDLVEIYKVKENKISVVHLANSLNPKCFDNNFKLPKKYILYVGGRQYYKNFNLFLKSIVKLLKNKNISLFCAGGGLFSASELAQFKNYGVEDKVHQQEVTDMELVSCYRKALCFVFPSNYEGFGIPILESFSCACPAVLSNIPCFVEIAGKNGIYFDPKLESSISDSVERVINDNKLRKKSINNGFLRLKNFSWKKNAEETLKVYESII